MTAAAIRGTDRRSWPRTGCRLHPAADVGHVFETRVPGSCRWSRWGPNSGLPDAAELHGRVMRRATAASYRAGSPASADTRSSTPSARTAPSSNACTVRRCGPHSADSHRRAPADVLIDCPGLRPMPHRGHARTHRADQAWAIDGQRSTRTTSHSWNTTRPPRHSQARPRRPAGPRGRADAGRHDPLPEPCHQAIRHRHHRRAGRGDHLRHEGRRRRGRRPVRSAIVAQLAEVALRIQDDVPASLKTRMFAATADLAALARWISHDHGRYATA